ncbi:c-type cytochrome [Sporosarcina sp. P7]|uniref:c-type cytochrome n=1 Tax=Sporosarcina sp. P7 TaxID=2048244 RepID=UPI001E3C6328|nr:c-type cytochrome [Sporosarcina sp. P7]
MYIRKSVGTMLLLLLIILSACGQDKGYSEADIRENLQNLDPDDPKTTKIERGKELFDNTNALLPENVGNSLSCISCHGDGGLSANSPMVGVTLKYPQEHHGKWTTIEDRVNGCFIRSMNGAELEQGSEDMKAMVEYLTFISKDVKTDEDITWRMNNNKDSIPEPDVENGQQLFTAKNCISCHAGDGSGTSDHTGPALWGDGSFNEAAGINRINKATGYIQNNMPKGQAGTLTDQEAADLAAFVLSHDRPEGDPKKVGDYHKDPERDYITKERRQKIRNGEFDWTELDVVEKN